MHVPTQFYHLMGSFRMFLGGQEINADSKKNGERHMFIPFSMGGCGFLTIEEVYGIG